MAARRRLSVEEQNLWQRVVQSVKPLHQRPLPATSLQPEPEAAKKAAAEALHGKAMGAGQQRVNGSPSAAVPQVPKTPATGLDKRTAQRLRKGKMAIEGRLDLHGMTQKQAHQALQRFITASSRMNRRLVLVITGKGWDPMASRPEDAVGVLRRSVPRWLETPPLSQHVTAIIDAHARDGGSGALYVLLRRKRRTPPVT